MLERILDDEILSALNNINYKDITEIRIRADKPILVYAGSVSYYLGNNGLYNGIGNAIIATKKMVEDIVFRASDNSMYAINEQLKKGFISLDNGIRIGVCGDIIVDNNNVKTINNFSSVNIRIPHQVKNCSLSAMKYLLDDNVIKNTLVISCPGGGKTTFIRDICYQISEFGIKDNIIIVDERGELAGKGLNIGLFSDVISFASKKQAIEQAIRTLNPQIIVLDELDSENDIYSLEKAFNCGVKIVATIHANDIQDLKNKSYMQNILSKQYFERYVVLTKKKGIGTIDCIYDKKFNRLGLGDL